MHEKEVLYTPTFYMKMYDLNIVFYIARDKWQYFYFSPWCPVFQTGPFFREFVFSQVHCPGPGPFFRRCLSNASSTTYHISYNSFFRHCLDSFVPIYCISHLLETATPFNLVQKIFFTCTSTIKFILWYFFVAIILLHLLLKHPFSLKSYSF